MSDTIIFLRDLLSTNVSDPLGASRPSGEKFVMTSYPQRIVNYPLITVKDSGFADIRKGGMQSEVTIMRVSVEVRVWARNVKERDEITQEVYDTLRDEQLTASTGTRQANLLDFALKSGVNVDDPGDDGIKSKVMTFSYMVILGQ